MPRKAKPSSASLEEEAKQYAAKKTPSRLKPLTSRRYLAGQALAGLLARSQGLVSMRELKREAYEWADYFLEDDD